MTGAVRLEPAHAPIAAVLHGTCFDAPWSDEAFAKLLAQPGVAGLLWLDREPVGFILIRAVADEAEILTLAVAPASRRRGIGRRLVHEACCMLRAGGTARVFLEVGADNAAAQALYARYGFTVQGRRPHYYDRGARPRADAIIMSLDVRSGDSNPGDMNQRPSATPHN